MGLRMRKSFKIAKGVRVNVGKSGVGVSFGTRGLRHSIHSSGRRTSTIGLPGSGISYSKTSTGGSRKKTTSNAAIARQLQKQSEVEDNTRLVDEYQELLERVVSVHKECDAFVDWSSISALPAPFNPPEVGPNQLRAQQEYESFRPNFMEKLFNKMGEKRRNLLKEKVQQAALVDVEAYKEWQGLHDLSERMVNGDIEAYFGVIEEMNPLDDLLEFGSEFEFGVDHPASIEVEFKVKSDSVVPNYVLSLTKTGKLSKKDMTKTQYYDIVQDYVCSCAIRIARDMMSTLPVEQVVVHAVDEVLNTATGYVEEITIVSAVFDRQRLNGLNFERIDPSDALQNFDVHMQHMKTSGFRAVERIVAY